MVAICICEIFSISREVVNALPYDVSILFYQIYNISRRVETSRPTTLLIYFHQNLWDDGIIDLKEKLIENPLFPFPSSLIPDSAFCILHFTFCILFTPTVDAKF